MFDIFNLDRSSGLSHTRRRLRSWKSSNTLNEDSNLDDEDEIVDVMPAMPTRRPDYHTVSLMSGDSAAMALSRFRTASTVTRSPERPWSSQDTSSNAAHLARGE